MSDTSSEQSSTALLEHEEKNLLDPIKEMWRKLKEENEQRKASVVYVTSEEATAITGYGDNGWKTIEGQRRRNR